MCWLAWPDATMMPPRGFLGLPPATPSLLLPGAAVGAVTPWGSWIASASRPAQYLTFRNDGHLRKARGAAGRGGPWLPGGAPLLHGSSGIATTGTAQPAPARTLCCESQGGERGWAVPQRFPGLSWRPERSSLGKCLAPEPVWVLLIQSETTTRLLMRLENQDVLVAKQNRA